MKRRPFTLVELLTVMVIIMILAGMVLGGASFAQRKARHSRTLAQIKIIEIAFTQYNTDWGFYPQQATAGPLSATFWDSIVSPNGRAYIEFGPQGFAYDDTNGNQQRDNGEAVKDPYGNPFYYQCPGTMNTETFDVWSMGMDGAHGDAGTSVSDAQCMGANDSDDVSNWKRN